MAKLSKNQELATRCSVTQIAPPDEGAQVQIIIRDGYGVKDSNGNAITRNSMNEEIPVSENDFSICMRIQYGDFVYATCGDMSGYVITPTQKTQTYFDEESSAAPMIGEVDLLKVNHHGSKSSTNTKWCNTLKPTVSVITCGDDNTPNARPLKNLQSVKSQIYTTGSTCNKDVISKYSGIIEMGDDVVIKYKYASTTFTVSNSAGKKLKTYNVKMGKKAPATCQLLEKE